MSSPGAPVRKRRRPAFSCLECRRRKVRCDRAQPCKQCTTYGVAAECTYERYSQAPLEKRIQRKRSQGQVARPQGGNIAGGSNPSAVSDNGIRGTVLKTRVFGQGHWMSAASMAEELSAFQPLGEWFDTIFHSTNHDPQGKVAEQVSQCKRKFKEIKDRSSSQRRSIPFGLYESLPDRHIVDELVELYFGTFERCYRILDSVLFREEYERTCSRIGQLESSRDPMLLKLLIVMTVAGTIHHDASVRSEMAAKGLIWIQICQAWLSGPLEKDRLTLEGIQIHCLLLLARQVRRVGADITWISAGSLMRMAVQMGLHQDPDKLGREISVREKENRRRLWYTILETNVQTALDSGMSPMITEWDYNTRPPSNASDHDLEGRVNQGPSGQIDPGHTSFQPLLASSLPLRLRATRVINSLLEEPTYEQVLALGRELAAACHEAIAAVEKIEKELPTSARDSATATFASSYCAHLLRRFILCLHFPHAVRAKTNPLYNHSHHVCLTAAEDLVSLLEDDYYRRVLLAGGGMFRDIVTRGALIIFLGLCPGPEEDSRSASSTSARKRHRERQVSLLQDARSVVQYARDRMEHGDINIKVYMSLNMMLAQAESRLSNQPAEAAISNALHESLGTCQALMERMASDSSAVGGTFVPETWLPEMQMPLSMNIDADLGFLNDDNLRLDFADSDRSFS